ncbi:MAG: methyltransferase [Clostridia bacterium]|nr:methyltransferase [Clostridia bacterium]
MIRKDDLQRDGLILYQDSALPCFTQDSVLLAHFLRLGPKDTVIDIGCGTGVLCVLGTALTGAAFTGFDCSEAAVALLEQSERENRQGIRCLVCDAADAPAFFGHGTFTAAVMNPPYFAAGPESPDPVRATARHGGEGTLATFFRAAFLLLTNGGRLFLCCPADRLADVFCGLRETRLEPKRLRLVAADPHASPRLALIEAKKLGKPGLTVEPLLSERPPAIDGTFPPGI